MEPAAQKNREIELLLDWFSKLHEFLSLYANGDNNSLIGLARAEDSINDKYDAVIGLARVGASTNTVTVKIITPSHW